MGLRDGVPLCGGPWRTARRLVGAAVCNWSQGKPTFSEASLTVVCKTAWTNRQGGKSVPQVAGFIQTCGIRDYRKGRRARREEGKPER